MSIVVQCQNLTFQDIRAVVFDKDGTLANSELFLIELGYCRLRALESSFPGISPSLLKIYGFEEGLLRSDGLLAVGTRQENEISTAACLTGLGKSWISAIEFVRGSFQQTDQQLGRKAILTPLLSNVRELLGHLGSFGLSVAILSSDSTENVVDFVKQYRLADLVHQSLGSDQSARSKPHPALFHHMCDLLGVYPHQTLMVGDSDADMIMAKKAGAAGAIGVTWGWTKPMPPDSADVVIEQCAQLMVVGKML